MPGIRRCYHCTKCKTCDDSLAKEINDNEELERAVSKKEEENLKDQLSFIEKETGESVVYTWLYNMAYHSRTGTTGFITENFRGTITGPNLDDVLFLPRDIICACPIRLTDVYGKNYARRWVSEGVTGCWRGSLENAMFSYVKEMRKRGKFKKAKRVRSPDRYGEGIDACKAVYHSDSRESKPEVPKVVKNSLWKHMHKYTEEE